MTDERKPLTPEELDDLEALGARYDPGTMATEPWSQDLGKAVQRLVAEIRRLREESGTDEWLERAVNEYGRAMGWQFEAPRDELLAILRKHRGGDA
jgi:hypothetical protein